MTPTRTSGRSVTLRVESLEERAVMTAGINPWGYLRAYASL
jgi:hypothetical protein